MFGTKVNTQQLHNNMRHNNYIIPYRGFVWEVLICANYARCHMELYNLVRTWNIFDLQYKASAEVYLHSYDYWNFQIHI